MKSPEVEIRLAASEDLEAIHRILAASFREHRSRYTDEAFRATVPSRDELRERLREGPVWLASLRGEPVATSAAVPTASGVYVRGMAVVPVARGRRLGWRLLERAERYARSRGAARLYLSSTPFLRAAIALYEGFGFERSEEGPHDLFGTPLFTMTKPL